MYMTLTQLVEHDTRPNKEITKSPNGIILNCTTGIHYYLDLFFYNSEGV